METATLNLETIDADIDFCEKQAKEFTNRARKLKAIRISRTRNFDLLRTKTDATALFSIMERFAQIKSPREIEVIFHVSRDRTAKEIGQAMNISPATVKFYKTSVYRKLGVNSERELRTKYFNMTEHQQLRVTEPA